MPGKRKSLLAALFIIPLLIVILIFLEVLNEEEEWVPIITREVSVSTDGLVVRDVYTSDFLHDYWITSDERGIIYSDSAKGLSAFDSETGELLWNTEECALKGGITSLIVAHPFLFAPTSLGVSACNIFTGENIWFTELGTGHAAVISQFEPEQSILRIYYGETVFELDPASGQILDSQPKNNLYWKVDDVEIYQISRKQIIAKDSTTGKQIWTSDEVFNYGERLIPQRYRDTDLLVKVSERICSLDFRNGYNWCRPEGYRSNIAFNDKADIGYALRDDFVLVKVDLQTGEVLGETVFLPSELPENYNYAHDYFVALTADNRILIFFGDSRQLFVLNSEP